MREASQPTPLACLGLLCALAMLGFGCSNGTGSSNADAGQDAAMDAGPDGADGMGDPGPDGGDLEPDGGDLEPDGGDLEPDGGDLDPDGGDLEPDGGDLEPDGGDLEPDGGDQNCPGAEPFDYSCLADDPDTCPGGICIMGLCIGPVLDPDRWQDCSNASCDVCETEQSCPADCGQAPETSGSKSYDNSTTITVWMHGFYNKSPAEIEAMVYGDFESCGGLLGEFVTYGVDRPCGDLPPGDTAPNQLVNIEYYGAVPPAWMDQTDIDEIEQFGYDGASALERFARISAKAIRHKLQVSGATHVNLCCHSFGCLITRHMIEHDLEGLASENRFVRWFTSAGVLAGARLARLYDNPTVRDTAPLLGLEVNDFVVMHPDFVQDGTCVWDHKAWEANHPLYADMIMHHATATDPRIAEALNIALLDLNNPDDEPNDGIMYTLDEYFHDQTPEAAFHAPDGSLLRPSHSALYVDHMTLPGSDTAAMLATANLFHRRKVILTLSELELKQDREHHDPLDGEQGEPPAEIMAEVQIHYRPHAPDTFGRDPLVHQTLLDHRSPEIFTQDLSSTTQPAYRLYAGPVFDGMDSLHLRFLLLEVDWYRRMGIFEYAFDVHELLYSFDEQVPLSEGVIERENEYVRLNIQVEVIELY